MKKRSTSEDAVLKTLVQGPERSPLFWWMYNHHAALERTWAGQRVNWVHFCKRTAVAGITDQTGKPPTQTTAAKTWERVRQQKAREQVVHDKRQRARNREPERGVHADRPPPTVTTPARQPPVPYYPPPPLPTCSTQGALHSRPDPPSKASGAVQTPEEMLADLTETINRRTKLY